MPQPATARPAPNVTWRAGNDKVAHGSLPRATRTLCGEPIVEERLAWPAFRRCMACRAIDERDGLVLPESELRLLDGNR